MVIILDATTIFLIIFFTVDPFFSIQFQNGKSSAQSLGGSPGGELKSVPPNAELSSTLARWTSRLCLTIKFPEAQNGLPSRITSLLLPRLDLVRITQNLQHHKRVDLFAFRIKLFGWVPLRRQSLTLGFRPFLYG